MIDYTKDVRSISVDLGTLWFSDPDMCVETPFYSLSLIQRDKEPGSLPSWVADLDVPANGYDALCDRYFNPVMGKMTQLYAHSR